MSLGMVNKFFTFPREVFLVFYSIPTGFQHQKLVSCMISYVVEPAVPFRWHLRSIISTLLCIFNPPVSTILSLFINPLVIFITKLINTYKCRTNVVDFCLPEKKNEQIRDDKDYSSKSNKMHNLHGKEIIQCMNERQKKIVDIK